MSSQLSGPHLFEVLSRTGREDFSDPDTIACWKQLCNETPDVLAELADKPATVGNLLLVRAAILRHVDDGPLKHKFLRAWPDNGNPFVPRLRTMETFLTRSIALHEKGEVVDQKIRSGDLDERRLYEQFGLVVDAPMVKQMLKRRPRPTCSQVVMANPAAFLLFGGS